MDLVLTIEPIVVRFSPEELEDWKAGRRDDCPDGYCRGLPGSRGFGEYVVGKYWQQRGYRWIHHDFSVFGGNRDEKYLESQEILKQVLGPERFSAARQLTAALRPFRVLGHEPFEEPDLLIYRTDTSEVRFAECKRPAVGDKLRPQQGIGLFLLGAVLRCPVDVFIVAADGDEVAAEPVEIRFTPDAPAS